MFDKDNKPRRRTKSVFVILCFALIIGALGISLALRERGSDIDGLIIKENV